MNVDELMTQLSRREISLGVDGQQLRVRAPSGALTAELKAALSTHKAALIELLRGDASSEAPQIEPRRGNQPPALSHAQQGLWLIDQLDRGGPTYNLLEMLSLRGALDVAVLERALTAIVGRHEILRTTFTLLDNLPVQQIAEPPSSVALAVVDLRSAADSDEAVREWAREELQRGFELGTGPLIRFFVLRLADEHQLLAFSVHHIVCDALSLRVLVDEIAQLYKAGLDSTPADLAPLALQYADFAAWHSSHVGHDEVSGQREYWKRQLAGAPAQLNLPTDHSRPAVRSFDGAVVEFEIDARLRDAIAQRSRAAMTTSYTTLLAALATLMARYSGDDEIVIGSPVSHRTPQTEDLVGFFINTLAFRVPWQPHWTTDELLERTRGIVLDGIAHKDVPFAQVVEDTRPTRSSAYTPVFQVLFAFLQGVSFPAIEVGGLKIERYRLPEVTAKFDLNFSLEEADGTIVGRIEYSRDIFEHETVQRLATHFVALLEGMTASPNERVGALPLAGSTDEYGPRGRTVDDTAGTVIELLSQRVAQAPNAVAVQFEDATLTYAALQQRVHSAASALVDAGVTPGDFVGLYCERSLDQIVGVLAIVAAGAGCLPLDIDYPRDRLARFWADSNATALLTHSALLEQAKTEIGARSGIALDQLDPQTEFTQPVAAPSTPAYLLFTSGSTGQPKGVAMSNRALANLVQWQIGRPDFGQARRTLQFAPTSFDVSFQEIMCTLCSGGTLVLIPEHVRREPMALLQLIERQGVERMYLPYVAFDQLTQSAVATGADLSKLREIYVAGEQLRITDAMRQFFEQRPQCTLHNQYGPTETHVVTSHRVEGPADSWPELPPIGGPIDNVQILLLDSGRQPVPVGPVGEIYVVGAAVADGYVGRDDLTAERFVELTDHDGNAVRGYKTGDLARWRNDGTLEFLGRADQQLKVRGFRVEPGEVEAVLSEHPDIRSAAVIGYAPSASETVLVGYYLTQRPDHTIATADLQRHVGKSLPDYMVPSHFVRLDAFPLTPSGKLDRKALPAPSTDRDDVETEYAAPTSAIEHALADKWSEVLDFDLVGIHDDFFELGGHSLKAAQILVWVAEVYGVEVPQVALFDDPTVAGLAQHIDQLRTARNSNAPSTDANRVSGAL